MQREKFSSRLGFILISAGCAIGLGNVWRFPYIVGKYGGAAFVLIYLLFLVILGLPIVVMEFSVGRASQASAALSFDRLEPKGTKWHWYKYGAMAGNYLLMMFYTTIAGWMVAYLVKMATGQFEGLDATGVSQVFSDMMTRPLPMAGYMILVVVACFLVCAKGLQKGVEKINKIMMVLLLALLAGLIIFPSCFAFGINPGEGPSLIFVTLPNVFNSMQLGRFWGSLFFLFMIFAAASTIIAVFQNIISFAVDLTGCSRRKAVICNAIAIILLSLPCVLGYNLWSSFAPLGADSTVQTLEDFIVSNNLLPLGSLVYLTFCTSRYGWGWKNFLAEADAGQGMKFPKWVRIYVTFLLPLIVLYIFVQGYISQFA